MKTRVLLETEGKITKVLFKGSDNSYKIWSKVHKLPEGARVEQILMNEHFKDLTAPPPAIEPVWAADQLEHTCLRPGFRAITHQLPNSESSINPSRRKK